MSAFVPPQPRRRRFWSDARFLLGVVLILVSIVGVWLVVSAARQTVPVLAASRTLVPGEVVNAEDLQVVDVALGAAERAYIAPGTLEDGAVATRTVVQGELVPADAIGAAAEARVTRVVVATAADVPASVVEGSRVEVWSAPRVEHGVHGAPRILVPDATVAAVVRDDAMVGDARVSLELVIPRSDVADALAALSDGSSLSVVPLTSEGS